MFQALVEIPYVFSQAVVYGVIVYAMIGFEWTAAKFFWYLFFMFFTLLYFTFYGMMAVAATPNQHIAAIVAAAFYGLWNLFSGFIVPRTVSSLNSLFAKLQLSLAHGYGNDSFCCISSMMNTEDSCVVEMVLLGMSSCMDFVWIGYITVWRYRGHSTWLKCNSETILGWLFWIQTWFPRSGCSCDCWVYGAFLIYLCLCH